MNNKKGFTLIELIVAMSVAAIFMVCVVALISPSTKIFNRTEDSSDARLLAESLLEEIRHEANLSTSLTAGATDEKGNGHINIDEKVIAVDKDGFLVRTNASGGDSQKLFDDKFYKNKTVGMTAANVKDVDNCVDMTLKIYSDGRELYSLDSRLKPVLGKSKTVVEAESEGPGGETGGVTITTGKEWKAGEYYYRGNIFKTKDGALYITISDFGQLFEHWELQGPDSFPASFAKIKDRILTDDDLVDTGAAVYFESVYPGDQYLSKDGTLYIYMNASGGVHAFLPSVSPNFWHKYN